MHDDQLWLLHPVFPRPPALPTFSPELCALIGLDDSYFEPAASSNASSPQSETVEIKSRRDTPPEALVSASGVQARVPAIRSGT